MWQFVNVSAANITRHNSATKLQESKIQRKQNVKVTPKSTHMYARHLRKRHLGRTPNDRILKQFVQFLRSRNFLF